MWKHFTAFGHRALHHARSGGLPSVMERVAGALKPSALTFASFKEAEANWQDGFGRFFCAMLTDRLRTLAEVAGLIIDRIERSKGRGYDGGDAIWLPLTAKKKF